MSAQNLSANNTKNNTNNNIPVSELSDYALNAPVEKFATHSHTHFDRKECGLKRSTSEARPASDSQTSVNGLQEFPAEAWATFVSEWNATGMPKYLAYRPSAVDMRKFMVLLSRYGPDGPSLLCESARESEWMRQQRWTLSKSLDEDLSTKIIDGQFETIYASKKSTSQLQHTIATQEQHVKGFFNEDG